LLQTFLVAHMQTTPIGIVTDGDLAMRNAIHHVLPGSAHRICIWHIFRNMKIKLNNPDLMTDFVEMAFTICDPKEWDNRWRQLLSKHDASSVGWLAKQYEERVFWAEAFLYDKLFLGVRSTQQSEGMNVIFRSHFSRAYFFTIVVVLSECVKQRLMMILLLHNQHLSPSSLQVR
jgi:hypothetical protein